MIKDYVDSWRACCVSGAEEAEGSRASRRQAPKDLRCPSEPDPNRLSSVLDLEEYILEQRNNSRRAEISFCTTSEWIVIPYQSILTLCDTTSK
jgi:hypothetical protein